MNRELEPCGKCARFLPDANLRKGEDGQGHCEGYERPAHSTDIAQPCVLSLPIGSLTHRRATRSEAEVLADLRRRRPETISRASAPTAAT
jgi:hypothetical protein